MKFFYDAKPDQLGIQFRPPAKEGARFEAMPGVVMIFDKQGNLNRIQIDNASAHQPDIKDFITLLITELLEHAKDIPQEVLLAIEGTIKLSEEPVDEQPPEYQPRFSFDSASNIVVVDFRRLQPGEKNGTRKEVIPEVVVGFNDAGDVLSIELMSALQHFPVLQGFINQGQELMAAQHILRQFGQL